MMRARLPYGWALVALAGSCANYGCARGRFQPEPGVIAAAIDMVDWNRPQVIDPLEDSGGAAGSGASTTSTTSGGEEPCVTCSGALAGKTGTLCTPADHERWGLYRQCACEGACAAACGGAALCGGAGAAPACDACLGQLKDGCAAPKWGCEHDRDQWPLCLADADCGFGQACAAQGTEPPACADAIIEPTCYNTGCWQSFCTEPGRYRATKHVVIDDAAAGRLWQRQVGGASTRAKALAYCAALSLDGIDQGWRLPQLSELAELLLKPRGTLEPEDSTFCRPAIDQAAFSAANGSFWVADEPTSTAPGGFVLQFDTGLGERWDTYIGTSYVRCIHAPIQ